MTEAKMQRGEQLLAREDGDVAEAVAETLREYSIEVLLEIEALRAEQNGDGEILLPPYRHRTRSARSPALTCW